MVKTLGSVAALALTIGVLAAAPAPPASADEVTVTYDSLITGPTNARVVTPTAVDVAPDGRIVVSSFGDISTGVPSSIRVFAPTASGDVAPVAGYTHTPTTWASGARGVAAGPGGHLHVGLLSDNSIRTLSPSGTGFTEAGAAVTGTTGIAGPWDIDMASGSHAWVASGGTGEVVLINLGAGGTPLWSTATPAPRGVAAVGEVVIVSGGSGAGSYVAGFAVPSATPLFKIIGPATGLTSVGGLAFDTASGLIYVTDPDAHAIRVFRTSPDGDVPPVKVLRLPATAVPEDVALDTAGNMWVVDSAGDSVGCIRALGASVPCRSPAVVTTPSKPRKLKVKGSLGARKRVVKWAAPANNGGTPVLRYRVIVKKGSKRLVKRVVPASTRRVVLKRSKLRSGVHTVRVKAINAKGASPYAVKRFRVRK